MRRTMADKAKMCVIRTGPSQENDVIKCMISSKNLLRTKKEKKTLEISCF